MAKRIFRPVTDCSINVATLYRNGPAGWFASARSALRSTGTLRVSRACNLAHATGRRRRKQAMWCLRVCSTNARKLAAKDVPVDVLVDVPVDVPVDAPDDALVDAPYAGAVKEVRESWPEVC